MYGVMGGIWNFWQICLYLFIFDQQNKYIQEYIYFYSIQNQLHNVYNIKPDHLCFQFDIMSVKGINLWIAFELLKTDLQHFRNNLTQQLTNLHQQTQSDFKLLLNYIQTHHPPPSTPSTPYHHILQQLNDYKTKYQRVSAINSSYEKQLMSLCGEIKQLRGCLNDLKQNQTFTEEEFSGQEYQEYFPEEIQAEKMLRKMDSSVNLERRCASELDIIKEVTEISMISDQELSHISQKEFKESQSIYQQEKYQSFQCTNSIHDINRLIFDGNSRQTISQSNTQQYKQQPNNILTPNQNSINIIQTITPPIPTLTTTPTTKIQPHEQIHLPNLLKTLPKGIKIQKKLKQNYYKCKDGYIYTGTIVKVNNVDIPMGFGQLFWRNQLLYCGNWKNGNFSGYGKMFFGRESSVKLFQGQLLNGVPNGCATLRFWNGDCFMGSFQHGRVKGMGTFYREGKIIYQGLWQQEQKCC